MPRTEAAIPARAISVVSWTLHDVHEPQFASPTMTAFAFVGAVSWKIGLIMGAAQIVGARVGAALAMRSGARLIKPLLIVACVALAVRLLLDETNPLRQAIGL